MPNSRCTMQTAYSRQCIGILIVSLACSALCHVLREKSHRLNSCANKQFNTCSDDDTMPAKKSSQILCTDEKQFLTCVLKSKACPHLGNEERVRKQKIPSIHDGTKIIRALPMHRNNNSLLRKYSPFHAKSPEIRLIHSEVYSIKRLWINDILYLKTYSNSLKSFQRVFLRSQLEANYVFNCNILCLRILPMRTPDVSKENQHVSFSRNLRSGIMNGNNIHKVCAFKNCPFRDTRLNILQSDLESNFHSSHKNMYSRLFRKMKRIDHARESRSVMYTSVDKLLSLKTLTVQNQDCKHDSYGEVTTMNYGLRLDRLTKIMSILNTYRNYTGYNSYSLVLTYFEGRLISLDSTFYPMFILMYNRYLNYQVNTNLQYINIEKNYTILQSDLIKRTLFVQNSVKKHISEAYVRRSDKQNNKIARHLGSEEPIVAKERSELQTRTNFISKYVNCKIQQHFVSSYSSENNCEKMHKENMQRTSRNDFCPENNSQKEIARKKRMVKNFLKNFRSPEKSTVLIESKRINVRQEHRWKNYIGSIFQLHHLTYKSKGAQNSELENIDSMYSVNGRKTIDIWSACNELLQHLILILLYTLHS